MWWLIPIIILLWFIKDFWDELSDSDKEKIIDKIIEGFVTIFKDYYNEYKKGSNSR